MAGRRCFELTHSSGSYYETTLTLFQDTAISELFITHDQLGNFWRETSDIDRALHHFQQAIRYAEQGGNVYSAAISRINAAQTLHGNDQLDDARAYAEAALANLNPLGDGAAAEIEITEELIAQIDEMKAQRSSDP